MALTRARVVAGDRRLAAEIGATIAASADQAARRGEARQGRARDARADRSREGRRDPWDLKLVSGGLIDIEFVAQYLTLARRARGPRPARDLDPRDARRGGGGGRAG